MIRKCGLSASILIDQHGAQRTQACFPALLSWLECFAFAQQNPRSTPLTKRFEHAVLSGCAATAAAINGPEKQRQ